MWNEQTEYNHNNTGFSIKLILFQIGPCPGTEVYSEVATTKFLWPLFVIRPRFRRCYSFDENVLETET